MRLLDVFNEASLSLDSALEALYALETENLTPDEVMEIRTLQVLAQDFVAEAELIDEGLWWDDVEEEDDEDEEDGYAFVD
jgi:hypothetical protein